MPYIRGQEVQEGPKQYPANPKMWNMLVAQARARFNKWPSPSASHWVHAHYLQMGGKFVDKKSQVDPKMRDYKQEEMDKKEAEKKKKIKRPIGKNTWNGNRFRG